LNAKDAQATPSHRSVDRQEEILFVILIPLPCRVNTRKMIPT
jgi:hypothetical protein